MSQPHTLGLSPGPESCRQMSRASRKLTLVVVFSPWLFYASSSTLNLLLWLWTVFSTLLLSPTAFTDSELKRARAPFSSQDGCVAHGPPFLAKMAVLRMSSVFRNIVPLEILTKCSSSRYLREKLPRWVKERSVFKLPASLWGLILYFVHGMGTPSWNKKYS